MKNIPFVALLIISLVLAGSCGGKSSSHSKPPEVVSETLDQSPFDGLYLAKFETLNPHINGTVPGSLTLLRQEDKLMVFVRMFAGGVRAWHQQGIYYGTRCPQMSDDINGDGTIDIIEAMNVVGKMIVPLDANINSQVAGRNLFPLGDLSGYYHYERMASFNRLFEDLHDEDTDLEDHIGKLEREEKFSFEKRVILVQGVTQDVLLPETVAGLGKRKPFQTLPVTCGIILKVNSIPGTVYTGVIPGPVAEVGADQDQPSTGGIIVRGTVGTSTGETTGGTTGGTTGETTGGTTGETTGGTTGETTGGTETP
jgi:hypothetical protein